MKTFSIVLILLLIFSANTLSAQSYETELISAELYTDIIERTGKLDYKRSLSLSFKNSGYLQILNVDEGEKFTEGQLLASLDITELKEQKNSNYAQLTQAKREVTRITSLMNNKLASERDMDNALTRVETARAAYQVSYYNFEKAQIYAPFSGIVLARNTELGELQSPGREILKVAKLEWIVKVALTGQEVSRVQLKQKVKVSLSHVGILEGVVSKIPAIANTESNLFIIEVLLPKVNLTAGMIAGQFASVSITTKSDQFIYRVPIAALVAVDDDGRAILIAQASEGSDFQPLSLDMHQLDNDYIYLKASNSNDVLKIITKGWQNYTMDGN